MSNTVIFYFFIEKRSTIMRIDFMLSTIIQKPHFLNKKLMDNLIFIGIWIYEYMAKIWFCTTLIANVVLLFNKLRQRHSGRYLANGIFRCISLTEKFLIGSIFDWILFSQVQLPTTHNRRTGDKTLSVPTKACLQMHIRVGQPQWDKLYICTVSIQTCIYPRLHDVIVVQLLLKKIWFDLSLL